MDEEEILVEFRRILDPYVPDKSLLQTLNERTDLIGDLKINSAHLIDVILDAENRYGIEIDNDSFDKMSTIGGCLEVIGRKIRNLEPGL